MLTQKFYLILPSLLLILQLQSCTQVNKIDFTHSIEKNKIISNSAAISSIIILDKKNEDLVICTQPYPDSGLSEDKSVAFSINLLNYGNSKDDDSDKSSSQDIEFEGRTPVLLLARELFYRQCEFSYNNKLKYADSLKLYTDSLAIIKELAIKEVQNTQISIKEALKNIISDNIAATDNSSTKAPANTNTSDSDSNNASSNTSDSNSNDSSSNDSSSNDSSSSSSSSSSDDGGLSEDQLSDDLLNQNISSDGTIKLK